MFRCAAAPCQIIDVARAFDNGFGPLVFNARPGEAGCGRPASGPLTHRCVGTCSVKAPGVTAVKLERNNEAVYGDSKRLAARGRVLGVQSVKADGL